MKLFHRHDYQPNHQETTDNGVVRTTTSIVKCAKDGCAKEGVSGVRTKLNPEFRDRIIDNQ
jgi:hypothetical protein